MTSTAIQKPDVASPQKQLRVLYADDVRELREIVRSILTREGHRIECVADGQLALHRVMTEPPFDLVITDHHMPNLNGLELVGRLRVLLFRGKILIFSSELNPAVAADYRQLGVDRILDKPVSPSLLRQAIGGLFGPVAPPPEKPLNVMALRV
jgi:two-component system chemotaxis response regulator CheY